MAHALLAPRGAWVYQCCDSIYRLMIKDACGMQSEAATRIVVLDLLRYGAPDFTITIIFVMQQLAD